MPEMDGLSLCDRIKSDLEFSHIPIILLTAKTNIQTKIEGMKSGADAYIDKPFSMEYLKACISSLLNNREKLRAAFANSPFIQANSMAMSKADEKFLKTLNEVVFENMQNPDFCLDDMASILNMSRSSLNRKIKGILDLTPNDYIRLERLKKAAQLLNEGESRVNEICYMVGFNTPSYFTKCFQKQFGVLPKDFVKKSSWIPLFSILTIHITGGLYGHTTGKLYDHTTSGLYNHTTSGLYDHTTGGLYIHPNSL